MTTATSSSRRAMAQGKLVGDDGMASRRDADDAAAAQPDGVRRSASTGRKMTMANQRGADHHQIKYPVGSPARLMMPAARRA